jgi:hypothetical protein
MTSRNYTITGPASDRDRANAFAATLDPQGGHLTFREAFLYVIGADPDVPTHTACHGPIADAHAPAVQAAIDAHFPDWLMIEGDDPDAALAQAGLARVITAIP